MAKIPSSVALRAFFFLALAMMEVTVFTPLAGALLSLIAPVRPLSLTLAFLLTVAGVCGLARGAAALRPAFRYSVLGVGVLISALGAIHRILYNQIPLLDPAWVKAMVSDVRAGAQPYGAAVFLLVLFLWWRGLILAQRLLDSMDIAYRFRLGLVLLAVSVLLGGAIVSWPYHYFVFAFFFASLLAIALARVEEVGERYGGGRSPFNASWLATLVAASLAVLLLAAGAAALLTAENVGLALVPVLYVLRLLLFGMVYVMAGVVRFIVAPLLDYLHFSDLSRALAEIGEEMTPEEPPKIEVEEQEVTIAPEQMAVLRLIGAALGAALLMLLVIFSLRRLRAGFERRPDEERDSVWEGMDARRGLRDLLARGRRRIGELASGLRRSRLSRAFAALTIRRIYAHMGALAAEHGYPRALHETPYEYLPALQQAFPETRAEAARITEAYVAAHYGEVPDSAEELEAVRAAWRRIQTAVGHQQPADV